MSTYRMALAVLIVLGLSGCDIPIGLATDPLVKGYQSDQSNELESQVRAALVKDAALSRVKISVSRSNDLTNYYSSRYSILLAGEVDTKDDHDRACLLIPLALKIPHDQLLIADVISVGGIRIIGAKISRCAT